ncbi:Chromatin assembly factor 1 subunit A [Balamuthia mandrillaris]
MGFPAKVHSFGCEHFLSTKGDQKMERKEYRKLWMQQDRAKKKREREEKEEQEQRLFEKKKKQRRKDAKQKRLQRQDRKEKEELKHHQESKELEYLRQHCKELEGKLQKRKQQLIEQQAPRATLKLTNHKSFVFTTGADSRKAREEAKKQPPPSPAAWE